MIGGLVVTVMIRALPGDGQGCGEKAALIPKDSVMSRGRAVGFVKGGEVGGTFRLRCTP